MTAPFGFINAFKPAGISSAAFGNWVRRLSGAGAVGHWGTLDPGACGVLVLALGRATRLLPLMPHARKQYIFDLVVGTKTDSGDATGRITQREHVPSNWRLKLPVALKALQGAIKQTAPMHSAVKVGGRPLYRSARVGLEIPRAPREVHIYSLRALDDAGTVATDHATFSARLFVECEAGTYIRVLCEDIGRELGLPAHMGMLLRVAAGNFLLRDAVLPLALERGLAGAIIDPLFALSQPRANVNDRNARRFVCGNEFEIEAIVHEDGEDMLRHETLVVFNGRLLGSAQLLMRDKRSVLAPVRVLARPSELT